MSCCPEEETIDIDDFLDGKYRFPLTMDEFRKYVMLRNLNVDVVDFFVDVTAYCKLYGEWRKVRKRNKRKKEDEEQNGEDEFKASRDIMEHNDEDRNEYEFSAKLADMSSTDDLRAQSEDQLSKDFDFAAFAAKSSNHLLNASGDDLSNHGTQKKERIYFKNPLFVQPDNLEPLNHISSRAVSAEAVRLYQKYFVKTSAHYLHILPEQQFGKTIDHYVKAMEFADVTGLLFAPSPNRAFRRQILFIKKYLWKHSEYFYDFVDYSVGNIIPSAAKYSQVHYRSRPVLFLYMQAMCWFLVLMIFVILRVTNAIKRLSPAMFATILPYFGMFICFMLARKQISLHNWYKEKRETLVLSASKFSPALVGAQQASTNELGVKFEYDKSNADLVLAEAGVKPQDVSIELRPIEDRTLMTIQNRLVKTITVAMLLSSFLASVITAIF